MSRRSIRDAMAVVPLAAVILVEFRNLRIKRLK
jgi:hypothetical protein